MNDATDAARILAELRQDVSALQEQRDDDAVLNVLREIIETEVGDVDVQVTSGSAASLECSSTARSAPIDEQIAFSEVADTVTP